MTPKPVAAGRAGSFLPGHCCCGWIAWGAVSVGPASHDGPNPLADLPGRRWRVGPPERAELRDPGTAGSAATPQSVGTVGQPQAGPALLHQSSRGPHQVRRPFKLGWPPGLPMRASLSPLSQQVGELMAVMGTVPAPATGPGWTGSASGQGRWLGQRWRLGARAGRPRSQHVFEQLAFRTWDSGLTFYLLSLHQV